jgi:hypothetical protein
MPKPKLEVWKLTGHDTASRVETQKLYFIVKLLVPASSTEPFPAVQERWCRPPDPCCVIELGFREEVGEEGDWKDSWL